MASFVYKNGIEIQSGVVEIIADERTDMDTLSTKHAPGSSCLVTEDESIWILSPNKHWVELGKE